MEPYRAAGFRDIPDLIGRDFDEAIHFCGRRNLPMRRSDASATASRPASHITSLRGPSTALTAAYRVLEGRIDRIPLPEGGYGVACYFRDISARCTRVRSCENSTPSWKKRVAANRRACQQRCGT